MTTGSSLSSYSEPLLQSIDSMMRFRNRYLLAEEVEEQPSFNEVVPDETAFEKYSDLALGIAFVVTAFIAAKRMYINSQQLAAAAAIAAATAAATNGGGSGRQQPPASSQQSGGGAETTVVTAFYSLIFATSVLRATWFLVPFLWVSIFGSNSSETTTTVAAIQSTPVAVYAFQGDNPTAWIVYALSELIVTAGSLTLFSIFILILVYWADILKKYYNPGSRRTLPMATFLGLVATLVTIEFINVTLFLFGIYSTEGMILVNAIVLAIVSIICVCEITIFSRKFQNVLKTLGAINQVSTDSQIRRIVWITVTGNLFFFTRALMETIFASMLIVYWFQYHTINKVFTHVWWDTYTILKYASEITILALMLHILQSRFSSASSSSSRTSSSSNQPQPSLSNTVGYSKVPDASVNV